MDAFHLKLGIPQAIHNERPFKERGYEKIKKNIY